MKHKYKSCVCVCVFFSTNFSVFIFICCNELLPAGGAQNSCKSHTILQTKKKNPEVLIRWSFGPAHCLLSADYGRIFFLIIKKKTNRTFISVINAFAASRAHLTICLFRIKWRIRIKQFKAVFMASSTVRFNTQTCTYFHSEFQLAVFS